MNNQYQCFGRNLTTDCAQKLIQELFKGQAIRRREIVTAVFEQHHERGGMNSGVRPSVIQLALKGMKGSGIATNPEHGVWYIAHYVKTLNEFMEWASQFDSGENIKRYLFRGVSSANYKIDASAYRRIKKGRDSDEEQDGDFEIFLQLNKNLISEARFRGHDRKNGRKLEDLEVLAEFQHYGAATFLMDFTYNALVALWFACKEGSNGNSKDGKVVAVNPNDPKFIQGTQEFKIITLDLLEKKIDDFSLDNRKLYQWQPRQQQNERIIAQQSIFLFGVLEIEINRGEECIIDRSSKEDIRKSLRRIYGITPDMLFPDFDGFARQYSQDVEYIHPDSTSQYRERADEAFQKSEYEEAISNYNRAIELDQNDVVAYCNRGIVKYQLGQYQAAINDFDEAIYWGDNDAYTYFLRGISKYMSEQYTAAIDDYDEAIRRAPDQVSYTYRWRGFAKAALEQHTSAIDDFDEALLQNPDNAHDYFQRGISKYALEQYTAAIADFDEAIRIDPDYVEAFYHRAEANSSLGHLVEAKADLQTAKQLAEQIDDADIMKHIDDLLYEIDSRTVGGSENE